MQKLSDLLFGAMIDEYQRRAALTASGFFRAERAVLGYCGETFEHQEDVMLNGENADVIGELGDRFWYLSEICTSHNLSLFGVITGDLSTAPSQIPEARKKWLRGDYDQAEYTLRLSGGVRSAWAFAWDECEAAGLALSTVLQANLDKLADRQERGKIHGDGGKR